jgi:hypothetical protein
MFFRDLLSLLRPSPELPTEERRESMRLRCQMSALLQTEGAMHFIKVVDVTITGLCLEMEKALKTDQVFSLSRDEFGQPLQAQVLWCKPLRNGKGFRLGARYLDEDQRLRDSWLKPALRQAGFKAELPGEKRQLVRVPGRVACQIKGLTGEAYTDGEMLDLSLGGALVESPLEFPQNLSIEFETSPVGGLPPLKGIAKIASCQEIAGERKWRSGLRFTESKADVVRQYMKSMLASR